MAGLSELGRRLKGKAEPFYYQEGKETINEFSDKWMVGTFEWFPEKIV
ncbi:MAG: hypothetical protein IPJ45_07640 [Ignavibacteria bacterium]|nr:hypothetical protein [Ignavibacteria bacterium]